MAKRKTNGAKHRGLRVESLADLGSKAKSDPDYERLAKMSAMHFGCSRVPNVAHAMRWLAMHSGAADASGETTDAEASVVDEINFVGEYLNRQRIKR